MKGRARLLPLLGWTTAAACSRGEETHGAPGSEGPGGTLSVNGKDDHGHDVELSIRCERFDEVAAEGG